MLSEQKWLSLSRYIKHEIRQAEDEKKDLSKLKDKIEYIDSLDEKDPIREIKCKELYQLIQEIPSPFEDKEPSDYEGIMASVSNDVVIPTKEIDDEKLYDKVYGAWLGRCAGCLLGKPIECWTREKIKNYLIDTNQYPLSKYLSANISDELKEKYEIHTWNFQHHGFVDGLTYMPEDDDTNYTVLAFKMLWLGKPDFNANKVGEHWLYNLPILCLCTAERVAYANLCAGLLPPQTAIVNNPYRELIGAQIRGDFFGYVNPFNIKAAAKMAFEDAKLSHVKNGIYGEIFVSAMHAAAYADLSMVDLIKAGLSVVPKESRFTQKLQLVLDWYANGLTVEEVINNIHQHFDENDSHDWCHTISNAMVVAASLLYGELDFEKSIVISVTAGFDTDCNGATVGSILGLILGEKKIDSKWKAPLNDTLKTGVQGYSECKISDLAEKTCEIINRNK